MIQVKPNTSLLYSFNGADGELVLSLNPQTRFMASFDNNTVKLNGQGFEALVEAGQKVKKGTPILKMDLDYMKENAPSLVCPGVLRCINSPTRNC